MNEENRIKLMKEKKYHRVQANVDLDAICQNVLKIKSKINSDTKLMVIIKADGYGHGAAPVARALGEIGVDAYGVAIIEEAIELRNAEVTKPILILGYTPKEQYDLVVTYDVMQSVFQYEMAEAIDLEAKKQGKIAKIHIKIDTGMSRIGFADTKESILDIKRISMLKNIKIEGLFSHLACADEVSKDSAHSQLKRFLHFVTLLENENIIIPTKHISNSAAAIDLPEANLDMIRCGIATYGLYPSEWVNKNEIKLIPAMELKTHVTYVKEVEAGVGVSYGSTYVTERTTKIATIPVGYADGYSRLLSNRGRVIIHGKYAPIIGRVCMDQFMVDVSNIEDVKQGDIVTLLGKDGDSYISVEELAELSNSFNYELVCNVGKRIPRVYTLPQLD